MPGLDLAGYESFRQLISQRGIRAQRFKTNLEAMEAAELMATTYQLGDRVLTLARSGQVSRRRAEALLESLVSCFTGPVENAGRLHEIEKELKEYEK